ncbi:MAG: alpha/beta hydrolase family protein [Chitinophagaceae bacterium]
MQKMIISLCLLLIVNCSSAGWVDTVVIRSQAMKKDIRCVVIQPATVPPATGWPVVYLLHGYSGNYSNWIQKVPALSTYADKYGLMIVCPDGDYSSWYFDSPVDSAMRYETYIATEVPAYIESHYSVVPDKKGRAITGLSMGGHGGLFLGIRHADFFGACGSMSGGVDLNSSRSRFDISKRIGDTVRYASNWDNYSVLHVIEKMEKGTPRMIIDCGTEDFFYDINHRLHEKMLKLKIPHDYIERPGKHDWNYWGNAVQYQLLFFSNYFRESNK